MNKKIICDHCNNKAYKRIWGFWLCKKHYKEFINETISDAVNSGMLKSFKLKWADERTK